MLLYIYNYVFTHSKVNYIIINLKSKYMFVFSNFFIHLAIFILILKNIRLHKQ